MPSEVVLSGTANTDRVPGGGLDGTAFADRSAITPYDLEGTVVGDWTEIAPWLATGRRVQVQVFLDGQEVETLTGALEITENVSTLVRTATFSFFGTVATYYSDDALIRGAADVLIRVTCDDGSSRAPWAAFTGKVQRWSNAGDGMPVATVTAVSVSDELYGASFAGCLQVDAYGGFTRPQLLETYATAAGIVADFSQLPASVVVRKPVQVSGVTVEALLFDWGELEGWYLREADDGSLECLTEAEVLSSTPKFTLTDDLWFTCQEDPPNKPTTVLTVGGTEIQDPGLVGTNPIGSTVIEYGTNEDGSRNETWTTRVYWFGVLIKESVQVWRGYTPKGASGSGIIGGWTVVSQTDTTYQYQTVHVLVQDKGGVVNDYLLPTGQLLWVGTKTYGWMSPLANSDPGGGNVVWEDGTHHAGGAETFRLISETETTNTWANETAEIPCMLLATTVTEKGWYSPLGGSLEYPYDGGVYRQESVYTYRPIRSETTVYQDNLAEVEAGKTANRISTRTTTTTAWTADGYDTGPDLSLRPKEVWKSATPAVVRLTGVVGGSTHWDSTQKGEQSGPVPDPTTASGTTPQYGLTPNSYTLSAWTEVYPISTRNETSQHSENIAELERVTRRRLRSELGLNLTYTGPWIRGLKCWDTMELPDSDRGLEGKVAIVTGLKRSISDVANPFLEQTINVLVPPSGV